MLRVPIPIALAVLIVAGAATVYFYITVVSNPTQGAWTDQGNGTTYTYTVPAGQWVVLGAFSGSGIYIRSNVTFDIRYDIVSAVAFANDYMPEGYYRIDVLALNVQSGGYISLDHAQIGWCHPGSAVRLPNGMVMYYPNYTAAGADCGCIWPPSSYTIDSYGMLSAPGCAFIGHFGQDGVTAYSLTPPVYRQAYGMGSRMYYLYLRPVYAIWVRPSRNAEITVTVNP
jgi:hypothetical protein